MVKFLYIDDIPTPYRLGVMRYFASIFTGEFKVLFCAHSEPGREWKLDFGSLNYEVLHGYQWRPKKQKNPFSFKWNPEITKKIRRFSPDIVVISGYVHPTMQFASWFCRKNNIPYGMVSESSFLQSKPTGMKWKLKKLLLSPYIKNMSFALPVGKLAETYLRELGAKDIPMYYFPNCPDIEPITKLSLEKVSYEKHWRKHFNIAPEKKIILFVGRFIRAKRPLDLLESFLSIEKAIKKGWVLVFIGDGEEKNMLIHKAQKETNIKFLGWQSPEVVYKSMAIAEFMVLPSEHEPWGAVVNEAMAAKTFVIASDSVGAAHELIETGKNGYMFQTKDIKSLQSIMKKVIQDSSLRVLLSKNALKKYKKWDIHLLPIIY